MGEALDGITDTAALSAPKKREDGGCAFPIAGVSDAPGMTLRDYFAIRIIGSVIAVDGAWKYDDGAEQRIAQANLAYDYADALLMARSR